MLERNNKIINKELKESISKAEEASFMGWDFSYLKDRFLIESLSWDYKKIIIEYIKQADTLLDMGTGGGEFLSSIKYLPKYTYATEGYKPNVKIAQSRLKKIGVKVLENFNVEVLPFKSEMFDMVINRHAEYSPEEVKRILKKDGKFITQQVGRYDQIELNKFFKDSSYKDKDEDLENASKNLLKNGFEIIYENEEQVKSKFIDIEAVIYYLKAIPWQIQGFNIDNNLERLKELNKIIKDIGCFKAHAHRFILIAKKT